MEDYSLIINSLMNLAVAILGVIAGFYIGNQNYKSQRIYDKKLLYLGELYEKIVKLEFEIKRYAHFEGASSDPNLVEEKNVLLNKLKENFQIFQHRFWEIEIFLDDNIVLKINEFIKLYIDITSKLTSSLVSQRLHSPQEAFDSWEESFKKITSDLSNLKSNLKDNFKKSLVKIK